MLQLAHRNSLHSEVNKCSLDLQKTIKHTTKAQFEEKSSQCCTYFLHTHSQPQGMKQFEFLQTDMVNIQKYLQVKAVILTPVRCIPSGQNCNINSLEMPTYGQAYKGPGVSTLLKI